VAVEVRLTEVELDEALHFIESHGYAHYFPDPFEIEALRHSWDKIKTILSKLNLLNYSPRPPLKLTAPKQKFAVRPIKLCDPVDTILFTALALRLSPSIEIARVPRSQRIVHSFRLSKTRSGHFELVSEWDQWVAAIREREETHEYAAKADIVDFFPRVYLHRLENALSATTHSEYDTRALMRFLETWADGTSYGIPIGPKICIILAECLLIEVDDFLRSHGLNFIRYVDDMVFFGKTSKECLQALYILAERLEQTQGLSLNMAKTKILRTEALVVQATDPDDVNASLRNRVIEDVFGGDPYNEVDYDDLDQDQKALLDSVNAQKLLEGALSEDLVDLPMVTFVLNMLASLRRPEHIDIVLENLDRLLPVSDTVARFIGVFDALDVTSRMKIGSRLLSYIQGAEFVPDFQAMWLLQPFAESSGWNGQTDLRNIARDHKNRYVRRQATLALGLIADRSALLDLKSSIDDSKDWEWRAILRACHDLPIDERRAFFSKLARSVEWKVETLTDKATIEYIRSKQ
jgi:Reverse transcriptase (RNA-dependent DNA polymerase)